MRKKPKFRLKKSGKEWFVTLVGANGEPMWRSTEGFTRKRDAQRGIFDLFGALVGTAEWRAWPGE